ncbi:MAG TPA: type II toxin-antitoxin system VapC family toxin [Terriglobales bacterium]|nr:type II toxin-antitoxin system VapC family toxin [Terriglobales bacterium]
MYLVDTNIIIDALKAKRSRLEFLQRLSTNAPLAYCSIVVAELFAGFANPGEIKKAQADLLDTIVYVETTQNAAELAGTLQHEYKKHGVALATADALIAATAITEGHTLVTDNVKHFPMPELNLLKAPAL